MGLELRRRHVEGLVLGGEGEGGLELETGRWEVLVAVTVLGMVRGLIGGLVVERVSLGREGSVHWEWRRGGHELGADQWLHHLIEPQVGLWEERRVGKDKK